MDMLRAINRRITSEKFDAATGQLLTYALAIVVMLLGIRKVSTMQLGEPQLFFGLLLVLVLTLQMIIMGTILGLHARKP